MNVLVVTCTFVAHSYQGVRLDSNQREELEWPPSPARLHQALIAAALTRLPPEKANQLASGALEVLRWLERQQPPVIIASVISADPGSASRFRLAIPQNNPAKVNSKIDLAKNSTLLAPTLHLRAVAPANEPLRVEYLWVTEDTASQETAARHLRVLADLVAQVRYLGRVEDQIEAGVDLKESALHNTPSWTCETWRPTQGVADIDLWVPMPDTTDKLIQRHTTGVPARTRKPPAYRFLRSQGYIREAAEGLLPAHVSIFQLIPQTGDPDELPLSCGAENAGIWRSRIRERAIDIALERERWDEPDLAQELIAGHPSGQLRKTGQPHLAFVPLPSISSHGRADGRVRRFALLGYSLPSIANRAAEIYRVLSAALEGELVEAAKPQCCLQRLEPDGDKIWPQLLRPGRTWLTVTPVALARHFNVPTHSQDRSRMLTDNERHLRRLAEWTTLLRSSLRDIGLPEDTANTCRIMLTASPLVPNTHRAERYRPPGESAVFTHARLEFSRPVRGPLVVGDRRYQGYGLFVPG
jgi:CRISPR-associated protein Csb2